MIQTPQSGVDHRGFLLRNPHRLLKPRAAIGVGFAGIHRIRGPVLLFRDGNVNKRCVAGGDPIPRGSIVRVVDRGRLFE